MPSNYLLKSSAFSKSPKASVSPGCIRCTDWFAFSCFSRTFLKLKELLVVGEKIFLVISLVKANCFLFPHLYNFSMSDNLNLTEKFFVDDFIFFNKTDVLEVTQSGRHVLGTLSRGMYTFYEKIHACR